jgi:hypothetical protein
VQEGSHLRVAHYKPQDYREVEGTRGSGYIVEEVLVIQNTLMRHASFFSQRKNNIAQLDNDNLLSTELMYG